MDMEAGPSGINDSDYEFMDYEDYSDDYEDDDDDIRFVIKTDLDEFLENYQANPQCLLHMLSFLDFDECGYTRRENPDEEVAENNPIIKRIHPFEGFCVKAYTLENCVVFINICHCDDIQAPPKALLDTLLNMTDNPPMLNLPLSLGKPHRERDEYGQICVAFDIILSSLFYEQQVNKYELLRAYILSLCVTGINEKYYTTIRAETCMPIDSPYHGTMPRQYIERKLSAYDEDQLIVKTYNLAKAKRLIKWAKAVALKRLRRLLNPVRYSFKIRAPSRMKSRLRERAVCEEYQLCQPSTSGMRTRSQGSPIPADEASNPAMEASFPHFEVPVEEVFRGVEYLDMGGIIRIGINVESDHLPYPTLIPPGTGEQSVQLLCMLEYDLPGYDLDFEMFHLCGDEGSEYLVIVDLPYETNLEEVAVFASRDGIIACDGDARRFFRINVPRLIIADEIKITVNRLNMTISMPIVPPESSSSESDEDQEVPSMSE